MVESMIIGLALGVGLATLAATGAVAMAVYVAATEDHRFDHEECIHNEP